MVRAACDVAPVQHATRRTSRIRRVATVARAGEKGRALAAARHAPPVPVTEQIVQETKNLHPTDREPPAPAQALVSNLLLSEVAELSPTTLRKMPRLSDPGLLGMRAEHRYDSGSLAGNSKPVCTSCCTHSSGRSPPLSATISQGWTDHTACQTHRRTQTTTHDVFSPQARTQNQSWQQRRNQLQHVLDLCSLVLDDQTEQTR